MKQEFYNLRINTNGQKLYEFTDQTIQWISENHFVNGIINLIIKHEKDVFVDGSPFGICHRICPNHR